MAQKRMLSIQIVESYPFLSMPLSSQALYMHLVLNCDDDGIVEAYKVMMIVQAKPDDLQILVAKRFCEWLDERRMIMFISDWIQQNKIRADRYNPSIYQSLLPNSIQKTQKRIMSTSSEQCQTFLTDKKTDTDQVRLDQYRTAEQRKSNSVSAVLKKMGMTKKQSDDLIEKYGNEEITGKIWEMEKQANGIRNKGGWLVASLRCDGRAGQGGTNTHVTVDDGRAKVIPLAAESEAYAASISEKINEEINEESPFWEILKKYNCR